MRDPASPQKPVAKPLNSARVRKMFRPNWRRRAEKAEAEGARLREALTQLAKGWRESRAHTYASENADLYRGFDNGCLRCAEAIERLLKSKE